MSAITRLCTKCMIMLCICLCPVFAAAQQNPVIDGWYADPEGVIFGKQYWIYPTYSAKYEQQVFLDA